MPAKTLFIFAGLIIFVIALLNEFNVPLEIPTSNNYANMAIGAGLVAVPFVLAKHI